MFERNEKGEESQEISLEDPEFAENLGKVFHLFAVAGEIKNEEFFKTPEKFNRFFRDTFYMAVVVTRVRKSNTLESSIEVRKAILESVVRRFNVKAVSLRDQLETVCTKMLDIPQTTIDIKEE